MTKRRIGQLMRQKMSDDEAMRRHNELMQDPEYAAKWNELTAQLFGVLADLPEGAIPDDQ